MEKAIWIISHYGGLGQKRDDGLEELNSYLAAGWRVKQITCCGGGNSAGLSYAYAVIEQ